MAEVLDADLPVFPFRVNWKNGISERLEWKTDVLRDLVGNEQRRGLRLTPRRDFEVTLTVWDQERSFLDLWLHRMVGSECLFPLWHDSVRSTQAAPAAQNTIWVDTEGLEFVIGSYALLRGLTALSWARVQIAEVYADRIVTVAPLAESWPKGTRVEPLVRGWMSDQSRTNLEGSKASETQIEFQTTRAQIYPEGPVSTDLYLGDPVLFQQPNRTDKLDIQHVWEFFDADSGSGRRYRKSEQKRASASQKHSWFLKGRSAKAAFRSLLYALKGSLKTVWLPTFNHDLTLAQDAANGAASIYVNAVGYAYTGGPSSGREHIMIETTTGRIYRKVTGTAAAPAGQERLTIDTPLPAALPRSSVRRISWMDTARLQNDRIEFNHINAADGLSTVASIFQTFRDERVPPVILSAPIPDSAKVNGACGDDGTPLCYTIPSLAEFEGWYWEMEYKVSRVGGNPDVDLYNNPPWLHSGYWSDGPYDTDNWSWTTRSAVDKPFGSGEYTWQIQFLLGNGSGWVCEELWTDPSYCYARVYARRWDMESKVQVAEGGHFRTFPMYWHFHLPHENGTLGGPMGHVE